MKQLRIGDITIDAVIEREGPWRRPQDFFPAYDEAVFRHHLAGMEPEVYDSALGMRDQARHLCLHSVPQQPSPLRVDFVAEVADGRCELRLGAELPLAPSNEATALTPQRQRDLALTPHLGRPTVVAGRRA